MSRTIGRRALAGIRLAGRSMPMSFWGLYLRNGGGRPPVPPQKAALAVLSLLLFFPITLRADIVHLKSGQRVEGEVSPGSPGKLKVTMDKGVEVEFPETDVQTVEKKKSPQREFDEKLAALPADDIDGLLALAEWARERKLRSKELEVMKRVLDLDPNDPVARRELGYAVFRNRWVKESELRAKHGLVQFRGDWVTPEEKELRLKEELKKEIAELLRNVDSDNHYIREYSVRKLLELKDPRARSVYLSFIADSREAVRVVAVQLLAQLPLETGAPEEKAARPAGAKTTAGRAADSASKKASLAKKDKEKEPAAGGPSEEEVAKALHERVLVEESPAVRSSLAAALRKMRPRRYFQLALATISGSENALQRDRAAEGILFALRKAWVPEVIRLVDRAPPGVGPEVKGNPAVRSVLAKISREDYEYRRADWEAWWGRSQGRFADEG